MKKNRLPVALAVTVLTVVIAMMTMLSSSAALMGDVNKDNKVNAADARVILRASAKIEPLDPSVLYLADLDGDKKVQSDDARIVLRMAARLTPTYTAAEPDPGTTKEPVIDEPTTKKPVIDEPTTKEPVIDEPTTKQPVIDEPTTKELVVDEPTTKEPVVDEPTTKEPVIDEPTTKEPVIDEPTTEEPVTEAPVVDETLVDDNCYVDADYITYEDDGSESRRNIKIAVSASSEDSADKATYFGSTDGINGHDSAILLQEKTVDGEAVQDIYLINNETNSYLVIDQELCKLVGINSVLKAPATGESVLLFKGLEGWNAEEVTLDGVAYQLVTVLNEDGSATKYYLHKPEGRECYEPARVEKINSDGKTALVVIYNEYLPDPKKKLVPPADMTAIRFHVDGYSAVKRFAESLGITI